MNIPNKGFYRHINFMDVMVNVLEIKEDTPDYVKLLVAWWNKTYDMPIGIVEIIEIDKKDLKSWERTTRRQYDKNGSYNV